MNLDQFLKTGTIVLAICYFLTVPFVAGGSLDSEILSLSSSTVCDTNANADHDPVCDGCWYDVPTWKCCCDGCSCWTEPM